TTHCRSVLENPSARWAEGSAMFTIVASSTTISCASPTTPRIHQRRSRTLLMEVASGMRLTTSSFSVVTGVALRVQAHRREGERSSPDSGDPSARDPKGHPGLHITRTRSPSLTLTGAMALTSPAPRSERQPRKPAPGTHRLSGGTHKAHRRTDDRIVGWDDRLHQHRW